MSFGATKLLSASGGKAYEIDQSVLLDDGDGALLHRTPSSEGNRKTWTFSCWFKRGQQDSGDTASGYYYLFASSIYGGNETYVRVQGDHLHVSGYDGGSTDFSYYSYNLFRDLAAWYHVVVICDTTESAEADRVKIYINGETVSWDTPNHASLNFDTMINNTNWHAVGAYKASSGDGGLYRWDGYVAEAYLLDGTAKAVTAFGETDSVTGQWIPKKTAFTSSEYGTNGFYLKFASGAIGTDSSGEGNNYTTVNLANSDVVLDTPTNNFSTLNRIQPFNSTIGVLNQGNLYVTAGTYDSGHYSNLSSTFNVPASGKWYVECRIGISVGSGNVTVFGVTDQDINWSGVANENLTGMDGFFTSLYGDYIKVVDSGTLGTGNTSATATSYILGMALDVDNGYAYFGVDSGSAMVWYKADGSTSGGDPTSGSTGTGGFARTFTTDDTITVSVAKNAPGYANHGSLNILNFGQNGTFSGTETAGGNADGNGYGNFFRSPPSGYLALCSQNLPTLAVKKSTEHFSTVLYTGDGSSTRSITGVGFQSDFTWLKSRTEAYSHLLYDSVRGAGASKALKSNATVAEGENDNATYGYLSAFTSDGFNLVHGSSSSSFTNENTDNMVSWNWKAGGSSTTDVTESGSGTSRINASSRSVNTDAGFSIIKYTGSNDEISNGEHTKLNHGLSKAPDLVIIKNLDDTDSWIVASETTTFNDTVLFLNTDNGTYGSFYTGTTDPDSTYIYLGNATQINDDGENYICYAWHEVEGYSKFGKYEANNSTNGVFVNTGFTPAWIVFKYIDGSSEWWWMLESTRDTTNLTTEVMYTNATSAESTISSSMGVDFLSNGFKIRATNGGINSANTYFYIAFAEFPFKYANAR